MRRNLILPLIQCGDREDIARRLWAKVDKRGPEDCWPWTGAVNDRGRGLIRVAPGALVYAPRVAWALLHEQEPDEAVCHHCDNPACLNPAHLFNGTLKDNVQDMYAKGRAPRDRRANRFSPSPPFPAASPEPGMYASLVVPGSVGGVG